MDGSSIRSEAMLTREEAEGLLQTQGIEYRFFTSPAVFRSAGKQVLVIYRNGHYFDRYTEVDGRFPVTLDALETGG